MERGGVTSIHLMYNGAASLTTAAPYYCFYDTAKMNRTFVAKFSFGAVAGELHAAQVINKLQNVVMLFYFF